MEVEKQPTCLFILYLPKCISLFSPIWQLTTSKAALINVMLPGNVSVPLCLHQRTKVIESTVPTETVSYGALNLKTC